MQGKGIIKFFFILLTVVTLVQFLYMVPTYKVEKKADAYAEAIAQNFPEEEQYTARKEARAAYLDSMNSEVVLKVPLLKEYTYEELKQMQLALGLDLKGGMSTVLQVDLKELIITLSRDSKDPTFRRALDNASERLKNAQEDYVTLFGEEWAKIAEGKNLAAIFSRNQKMMEEDDLTFETPDDRVLELIRQQADATVELTFRRLKDRIDKFGVAQPNVSLDAARHLIIVELPGVDNPERARNFLQSTAKLEFWNVYRIGDPGVIDAFIEADQKLKRETEGDTSSVDEPKIRRDTMITDVLDSTGNIVGYDTNVVEVPIQTDPLADTGPLLSLLTLNAATGGQVMFGLPVAGVADENKMNAIDEMLQREDIRNLFPRDMKFLWSAKPIKDFSTGEMTNQHALYMIKRERGTDEAPLQGDMIVSASSDPNPTTGEVEVILVMNNKGAKIWADMTTAAAQDNEREIAIALDDEVVSAPGVREPITGGRSSISGNFSVQEGRDLANILEVGKLPAKTQIIQESLVGPSLGQDNIDKSLRSLLIGITMVLIFMIFYYGTAGIVSIIALFANLFFIFGGLASFGTVLTLPGIAGIVLTIGMAVDANVIIYERVREELRSGKSLKLAINDGFQQSYSAIIDANVTTILVAIILAWFGLGPIKGFAVVLIIGVISSLFTAVLLGRLMIEWWIGKEGRTISFWTPPTRNVLANPSVDWLGKRRIAYFFSGAIIIAGLIGFATRGFELGVDFKGGYSYHVQFAGNIDVNVEELRSTLSEAFDGEPVVKAVDTENTYNITTSYLINETGEDVPEQVIHRLYEGVNTVVGGGIDAEQFKLPDGTGTHVTSSSKVGPTIADDIKASSVEATVFALIMIFLYIFIRFSRWQYSLGAVAALFHDTLVVLGVFSLLHGLLPFSLEIDQHFIAALLTVIGYSINDTVVVFDRIREFTGLYAGKAKKEVVNLAINSTISRTLITSLTTLFVVTILFIFGGGSIKGFAFALVIGIIVGTYSSVFVATPVMTDLTGDIAPKETKKSKTFSKAATVR